MFIVSNVVFCTEFSPGSKYSELQIIRSSRGVRIRNKDSLASFQVVVSHDIVLVMARVSLCKREGLLSEQIRAAIGQPVVNWLSAVNFTDQAYRSKG